MALDDHRYGQERWREVLVKVLQSPAHRISLVRDPEAASEDWGFCPPGRSFLRIMHVLSRRFGEQAVQDWIERSTVFLAEHVDEILPVFAACGAAMRDPRAAEIGDHIAEAMGYTTPPASKSET